MQHSRRLSLVSLAVAMLAASGSASCFDPVHSDDVDALGPERKGILPGPNHRPGQNCRTCHGGEGPGEPEFSFAGTIYSARGIPEPLPDVTVFFEDVNGSTRRVLTNEVGNFYITKERWSPTFPVRVLLLDERADSKGMKQMISPIGRDGGCALCHYGADGEPDHMPPVFLRQKAL